MAISKTTRLATFTLTVGLSLSSAPCIASAQDGEVRKDPEGITGISPYNEALAKGRKAFSTGDHAGAISAFDDAIAQKSDKLLAYLLKAQAQLDNGDVASASTTAGAAQDKKGTEQEQSKMLFLVAELEERAANANKDASAAADKNALAKALQSVWDKVKDRWTGYSAFVAEHTRAPNYSATASDRKQKVDERVKREKDFGEVKSRAENK